MSIVLVVILSLVLVQAVSADTPAPGGPFSTAFRVQNLASSTASCTFTLYDAAGVDQHTSSPASINPGDSLFVYTPSIGGLAAGMYSAVVSCDQQVAAVTNFSDADSGASHQGINTPGTTWYAPGIYDNFYNFYTTIIAQNTTGSTVDMTVEIYEAGNPSPVATQTASSVPAFASVSFEQEGLAGLSTNSPYSARITATGDIAPVVDIYGRSGVDNQLYSYNPLPSGSTTAYAPVLMNNYYGYNTAMVIQNIGTATTDVTVTYSTTDTQTQAVAANSSWSIYTPGVSGLPSGNSTGLFSATVTSTDAGSGAQDIIVLVNESNGYNRAASYIGFSSGSDEVRAPIVMRRYYDYNTSVTCQVISGGPATMTIEYFSGGSSDGTTTSGSVATGQTALFYQPSDSNLSDGYIGSAVITSAADIACIVNEDQNEGSLATTVMDQLFSYEGIAP